MIYKSSLLCPNLGLFNPYNAWANLISWDDPCTFIPDYCFKVVSLEKKSVICIFRIFARTFQKENIVFKVQCYRDSVTNSSWLLA
jgi:hypothetical protein